MQGMTAMNPLIYEQTFPSGIAVPEALIFLRQWLDTHGYPISGCFELRADPHGSVRHWFGTDSIVDRFATFGAGPDGSPYAIWLQDDRRTPIVHMGSEGVNNFVLAPDFIQFLRLLAVGYEEIGFDDLSAPPTGKGANPIFQDWVSKTFSVAIPATGSEITEPAKRDHEDFEAWIQRIVDDVA